MVRLLGTHPHFNFRKNIIVWSVARLPVPLHAPLTFYTASCRSPPRMTTDKRT